MARIDTPGLLQHVMARGIERRRLFLNAGDYRDFLDRIQDCLLKTPAQIFAWALMPNHFHILIRSGEAGLASFMRRLLTGYAGAFNRRYHRAGHLFQNRYKSIVCEEETYLLELVRYIHLNPMRAGLLRRWEDFGKYPYTGHAALMGNQKRAWQSMEDVLCRFGKGLRTARRNYEKFVREGFQQRERPDLEGGGLIRSLGGRIPPRSAVRELFDARVLGPGPFVENVLKTVEEKEGKQQGALRTNLDVQTLGERLAREYRIDPRVLFERNRTEAVSKVKAVFVYMGATYLHKTNQEMANWVKMSGPGASKARERGRLGVNEETARRVLKVS